MKPLAKETKREIIQLRIKRCKRWWWNFKRHEWKNFKSYIGWEDYIALVAILIGGVGYIHGCIPIIPGWTDFYYDIRSTLIGLGLTVLIIDNVNEMYRRRAEKERLILQMGSPDHGFAIEAVRQLRIRGWLQDGSLNGALLLKANLSEVNLHSADLTDACLDEANLSRADLSYARMTGIFLKSANLEGANLVKAKLMGAYLMETCLTGAQLTWADLTEADLRGAQLNGASMSEVQLTRSDLTDADLSMADLRGAILKESIYDDLTKWPYGFDPTIVGATKVPVELFGGLSRFIKQLIR